MARKKYGRYRRKRYYRRYKSIPYNTFKARVETIGSLTWPLVEGQPIIYISDNLQGPVLSWENVLSASQAYDRLKVLFGYMKIIGVKLQLTPIIRNFSGSVDLAFAGQVYAGMFFGNVSANTQSAAGVSSLDNSIMCNTSDFAQCYCRAKGEEARWHLTSSAPSGGIICASTKNGTPVTAPIWNFRLIVYIAFKRCNV